MFPKKIDSKTFLMLSGNNHMSNKMPQSYVIKRDGRKETVYFDKITQRISKLLNGDMIKNINILDIVKKTISAIYTGITTRELDAQSAYQCAMMTTRHYDYALLAGRIYISSLHKETMKTFVEKMEYIQEKLNIYDSDWMEFIKKHKNKLNKTIDYNRDFLFDYFGAKTMERVYMTKCEGQIIERPQDVFMRVASLVHCGDLNKTIESYNLMSKKYFTHASPTLFNAGNKKGNLVSCFLLGTEDSISGISKTWNDVSHISKWGGGIGIHVSNIRAKNSPIRSTNGHSDGIIPMLKVYNSIAQYINQSGKRKGSFAIYLEPHHPDVFEFLELRKNTGAESERARDLFLAVWVSDLFMKQVKNDNDWYLFCPDKAPGLNDVYGEEYEELFWQYVKEEKYNEKIKARKLWLAILNSQFETGAPYILYKDTINRCSNQKNIGVIKSSNLCAEIVEYSDTKETAACNLASLSLPNFIKSKYIPDNNWIIYTKENCNYCNWAKKLLDHNNIKYQEKLIIPNSDNYLQLKEKLGLEPLDKITFPQIYQDNNHLGGMEQLYSYFGKDFDYQKLWEVAYHVTSNLNNVIDRNYYPTTESRRSNMKHRPIGLGVQGLADVLALLRIPYASEKAKEINENIFGIIYHASLTASNDIAKEREEQMKLLLEFFKDHPKKVPKGEFYDPTFECYPKKMEKLYHKLRPHSTELNKINYLGTYSTFDGSPFSQGKLQYHLANKSSFNIGSILENKSWDELIDNIKKYGVRNSLLTALMPTASTSQLLGNYESFEAFTSNLYKRRTLAGEFIVVNKHLINDLLEINEWSEEIKDTIVANNGSIQSLNLPKAIKDNYLTAYEMKQKYILDGCITRSKYIDQTQSMNLYFTEPDSKKLTSAQFYAWENGLKTGLYYLRSKSSTTATKITLKVNKNNTLNKEEDEGCLMCSA